MKKSLILAALAVVTVGSVGCASRPMRSIFHRGAECGSTVTAPLVGDAMATYSPGCGMEDCATCGTTSGMPVMMGDGYLGGYTTDPATALPEPLVD